METETSKTTPEAVIQKEIDAAKTSIQAMKVHINQHLENERIWPAMQAANDLARDLQTLQTLKSLKTEITFRKNY